MARLNHKVDVMIDSYNVLNDLCRCVAKEHEELSRLVPAFYSNLYEIDEKLDGKSSVFVKKAKSLTGMIDRLKAKVSNQASEIKELRKQLGPKPTDNMPKE
jgi:predicted RNase H-like nuclease (RuvC/YqgF family)